MREKEIEKYLVKRVKETGGICEKWNSGTAGWPDRIVLLPEEKVAFVEVKAPGKKPRKIQAHRHEILRRLGFRVFVFDEKKSVDESLKELLSKEGRDGIQAT